MFGNNAEWIASAWCLRCEREYQVHWLAPPPSQPIKFCAFCGRKGIIDSDVGLTKPQVRPVTRKL